MQDGEAMVPSISTKQGPSRRDWERLKPIIRGLYLDEEKTLKEVMTIMEQDYGHVATIKMYKSRITNWKLDKRNKEPEMAAILRKKSQRDTIGKASSFRLRERPVSIENVLRYCKRKKLSSLKIQNEPVDPSTPSDLICWTPDRLRSPEPWTAGGDNDLFLTDDVFLPYSRYDASGSQANYDLMPLDDEIFQNYALWEFIAQPLPSPTIPQALLPPQTLLLLEKFFASIKSYIEGSISKKTWISGTGGGLVRASPTSSGYSLDFKQLCFTAGQLMKEKSFVEGRRLFSQAFRMIERILVADDPHTLEVFLESISGMIQNDYEEVASMLRSYLSQVAAETLSKNAPLREICILLGHLDAVDVVALVQHSMECIIATFSQTLGPMHYHTVFSRIDFLLQTAFPAGSREAEGRLRELLADAEHFCGGADDRTLAILYRLSIQLYLLDECEEEALALAKDLFARARDRRSEHYQRRGLEIMAYSQYELKENGLAERNIRKTIEMTEAAWGKTDPECIQKKTVLESWLRGWGREDEADELKAEIWEDLGPDELDE